MISNERNTGLRVEGGENLARLLFDTCLVKNLKKAEELAITVGAFTESSLKVEGEGNEVKATLNMGNGKLEVSFRRQSFELSFRDKTGGTASYYANSPVEDIRLNGPFLSFVLDNGETVRAVKEYGTISIDHYAFGLYPV